MKKSRLHPLWSLVTALCAVAAPLAAETGPPDLSATILQRDSLFWKAYNSCDVNNLGEFFTEDVEFYHDRGGITLGLASLAGSLRDNLCSNPDFRVRREAVDATVRVFPLKKENTVYGAILSGEHLFYVLEKGKPERADGLARFTHLWLLKDGAWKMTRVLSYDHGPAPHVSGRNAIALPDSVLDRYVGPYRGSQSGVMVVRRESGLLALSIGDEKYALYPESDGHFFTKERDLTFEFLKNDKGDVSKMVVRERAETTEEAARLE